MWKDFAFAPAQVRPWSDRPIVECHEPLAPLPPSLLRLTPHPYQSIGAPYGPGADPFRLRSGVVKRLLEAQVQLQQRAPSLQLAIFDAWRPVAVQAFMVNHAIAEECQRQGVDPSDPGQRDALSGVITEVGRFWAPPSDDPATPPPHSTGAAVDLTLAESGAVLDMGGEIDAIGAISDPDHYLAAARSQPQSQAAVWQRRRDLLKEVMVAAGFEQHPNEWWHFSHGDQLWAWRCGAPEAIYAGALVPSSSATV